MTVAGQTETGAEDTLTAEILDVFGFSEPEAPVQAALAGSEPQVPAGQSSGNAAEPAGGEPAQLPAGSTNTPTPAAEPSGLSQTPEAPAAPDAPTPAAPQPASGQENQELVTLRAQLAAAQAQLAERAAAPAPQAPQGGQPTPAGNSATSEGPQQDEPVRYGLQVPDDLLGAIFAEDMPTSKKGIETLVNSLATVIHANVMKSVAATVAPLRSSLETQSLVEEAKSAQALQAQYYEAFPDHGKPTVKLIVQEAGAEICAEIPGIKWGPEYIAAVGARVNQKLAELGVTAAAQPAAQPTVPVPLKPAASTPAGNRTGNPPPVGEATELGDQVAELFSFD